MEVDNSVTASGDDKEGNPFKKKKKIVIEEGKRAFTIYFQAKKMDSLQP